MAQDLVGVISEDAVAVVSPHQVSTGIPDEVVILNIQSGKYHSLSMVGARVWSLIQTPRTVREIHELLLEEYDADADTCRCDLLALLKDLVSQGLVELDSKSIGDCGQARTM